MTSINIFNIAVNDYYTNVILIESYYLNLSVKYSCFFNCYSIKSGCAISSISNYTLIKNLCADSCSSNCTEEPGGALIFLDHDIKNDNDNNILYMLSYTNTPNDTSTYSSVTVRNGNINIKYINPTKNSGFTNAVLYIRKEKNQIAECLFINGVDCYCCKEVFFNALTIYTYKYVNMIRNTCLDNENAVIRTWGDTRFYNSVFIDNIGNLFIPYSETSKITLYDCYYSNSITTIGQGSVIGTPIDKSETNNIVFDSCGYSLSCSIIYKNKKLINNNLISSSLFIIYQHK